MQAFYTLILLLVLLTSSCTSKIPELELKVIKSQQSSNLNTLTYVIQVQEKNNICNANSVEFVMKIKVSKESEIDPGKTLFAGETFGTVPRGETLKKTFTFKTNGRIIDLQNGVILDEAGFESANCIEETPI